MNDETDPNAPPAVHSAGAFRTLRQFVRKTQPLEHCELCDRPLAPDHQHLLDPANRKLICSCDACSLLFTNRGETKYKRVPRRIRFLPDFQLTESQWDDLRMPINLAFFFHSTPLGRVVALYPSPAGATESLLSLDSWGEIVQNNPELADLQPDVEALLVNRVGHARGFTRPEYYVAPIDQCFKLVGLIRSRWQGLSGGTEVWQEIAAFFSSLRRQSGYSVRTLDEEQIHA